MLAISVPGFVHIPSPPVLEAQQSMPDMLKLGLSGIAGICWILVYASVIRRGYLDKRLGIPLAALGFDIAWEFSFSFIFYQPAIQRAFNMIWFLLDLVILSQALKYGRKDYPSMSPPLYIGTIIGMLAFAFPVMILATYEFADNNGGYTAFGLNAFLSFAFVNMLLRRRSTQGQTMYIAVAKMIGSMAAAGLFINWYPQRHLLYLFYVTMVFLDATYTVMLYRRFQCEGLAPWRKF